MSWYFLCEKHELPTNSTKSFSIDLEEDPLEVLVLTQQAEIYAYKNSCPHLGIPLNWQPDKFLSPDETHIQCSTHGALFTFEDGYCVAGPCSGQSLISLSLEQRNDEIWLQY
mgnify:CR=1 FL=1